MTEPLYRMHWIDPVSGQVRRGHAMPKAAAEAWLANARINTPQHDYWLAPVAEALAAAA